MRNFLFLCAAVLCCGAPAAASCPCITYVGTPAEVAAGLSRNAAAVFEANVLSVDSAEKQARGGWRYTEYTTTLNVGRVYRGPAPPTLVIRTSWGDCHFRFEAGRSYLVFASRDAKGNLIARNCVGAVPLESAAGYLDYFRATGSICGRVTRWNGDAVPDAPIFLWRKREGKPPFEVHKGRSDADGRYCVSLAPLGRYVLAGIIDLENPVLYLIGYYNRTPVSDDEWNVEIPAADEFGGFDIVLVRQLMQTIRGKIVTQDGSPLPAGGLSLQLFSSRVAREHPRWLMRRGVVNPDGTFRIDRVPHAPVILSLSHFSEDPAKRREWAPTNLGLFTTKDRDDIVLTLRRLPTGAPTPKSR